ncbi:hypothetical protein LENED_012187 [Lentinula edodes]|uniref:Uncharacterized protein n=1 Tax=Lentinula edodes TaxID=5353 RepID=A0A1Q3ERZ3_LENED|nr:hypothetical protein LENED_012187 [Lentinula edodes]
MAVEDNKRDSHPERPCVAFSRWDAVHCSLPRCSCYKVQFRRIFACSYGKNYMLAQDAYALGGLAGAQGPLEEVGEAVLKLHLDMNAMMKKAMAQRKLKLEDLVTG